MSDRAIRDAILQITGNHLTDKVYAINATVNSVDLPSRTCVCQVVSGRANNIISDVRLMCGVDDGMLIVPTVGSDVNIVISDYTDPYITQYSGIDKIILRGGDLGGLVKVLMLLTKLNNIENIVNDLIVKFNTHTHNVTAVSAPTGPNLLPKTNNLILTNQSEIENKLITHG